MKEKGDWDWDNFGLKLANKQTFSIHQVDRLGVNKWRLREVKYQNRAFLVGNKSEGWKKLVWKKIQAHVVCRMLGFPGARRAFIGCRSFSTVMTYLESRNKVNVPTSVSKSECFLSDTVIRFGHTHNTNNPIMYQSLSFSPLLRFGRCSNNFAVAGIGCSGRERSVADCRWEFWTNKLASSVDGVAISKFWIYYPPTLRQG